MVLSKELDPGSRSTESQSFEMAAGQAKFKTLGSESRVREGTNMGQTIRRVGAMVIRQQRNPASGNPPRFFSAALGKSGKLYSFSPDSST